MQFGRHWKARVSVPFKAKYFKNCMLASGRPSQVKQFQIRPVLNGLMDALIDLSKVLHSGVGEVVMTYTKYAAESIDSC